MYVQDYVRASISPSLPLVWVFRCSLCVRGSVGCVGVWVCRCVVFMSAGDSMCACV
jgi:hypothetical protein